LDLEASAVWVSPSSRGLYGGETLLLSTRCWEPGSWVFGESLTRRCRVIWRRVGIPQLMLLGTLQLLVFWWVNPDLHSSRARLRHKPKRAQEPEADPEALSYLEHKRLKALRRREQAALEARTFQQWDEIQSGVSQAATAPPVVTAAELFFMDNDDILMVRVRPEREREGVCS
jgi:hypothetical protein